ncbi:hypothetical protein [Eupransor demetentiae]|uniref:Uncharacterized protein n=1 Tax=Eupransor demetentiae TaxID=3109584 RepID=A0ABP0ER43_9LACO|nr:hypothetical protein R54876_GBNLAHCA_01336 [Lactobacillaceae bacterium LMG 33000]
MKTIWKNNFDKFLNNADNGVRFMRTVLVLFAALVLVNLPMWTHGYSFPLETYVNFGRAVYGEQSVAYYSAGPAFWGTITMVATFFIAFLYINLVRRRANQVGMGKVTRMIMSVCIALSLLTYLGLADGLLSLALFVQIFYLVQLAWQHK